MQSVFPSQPLTRQANGIYLDAMTEIYERLGGERFDSVITECVNSCRFMPTIAEIRERAGMLSEGQQKAASGEAAWDFVKQYIRKWYGLPGPWERLPEAIDRASRAVGGIRAIAEADVERIGFVRRDFLEAFRNGPAAKEYAVSQGWALPEGITLKRLEGLKKFPGSE